MDIFSLPYSKIKKLVASKRLTKSEIEMLKLDKRLNVRHLYEKIQKDEILLKEKEEHFLELIKYESQLKEKSHKVIVGVDEVGRGSLCGPVVAAAVCFDKIPNLYDIDDSKKLTEEKREFLYDKIIESALAYGIGMATNEEIDKLNIIQATFLAMKRAIEKIKLPISLLLIDGNAIIPNQTIEQKNIIGGDRKIFSIAAASILAKVYRDRLMDGYHKKYPQYDLKNNKGYGTPKHLEALRSFGFSEIHRKTFLPAEVFKTNKNIKEFLIKIETAENLKELEKIKELFQNIEKFLEKEEINFFYKNYDKKIKDLKNQINNFELGKKGEEYAANLLLKKGFVILERNFKIFGGEIDIIAQKDNTIVFVEVKLRNSDKFGSGKDAVNNQKVNLLKKTAYEYLKKNPQYNNFFTRFDLIIIENKYGEYLLEYIEGAIQ